MDKREFVEKCGELLNAAMPNLLGCEYKLGCDIKLTDFEILMNKKYASDGEYVLVWHDYGRYVVDVTANSFSAIAEQIFRQMAYK